MKLTNEDREIIENIKKNGPPLLKGSLASLPFIFLAMACVISGNTLSAIFFSLAQFFTFTCFHKENKMTKTNKIVVIVVLSVMAILLLK